MCNCTSGNLDSGFAASPRPGMTSEFGNTPDMDAITPSAVALKNVARRFVTPTGEILSALEDFDLSIAPGEFFAIVGPTGCGKSTTLGLIAGLAKPQAGEVDAVRCAGRRRRSPGRFCVSAGRGVSLAQRARQCDGAGRCFAACRRPRRRKWRATGSLASG